MKKIVCFLLACALCGLFAVAGCSSNASSASSSSSSASSSGSTNSTSAASTGTEVTQADIEKMIVGTWVTADRGGQLELSNDKVVFDFVSDAKAYVSAQFELTEGAPLTWTAPLEADVAISGNKVTITDHPADNATAVSEFTVTAISSDELTVNHELTLTVDGKETGRMEDTCRYVKVDVDYGKSILGTWEGSRTSDRADLVNGQVYRFEFKDDGTYCYYKKDGDNWVLSDDMADEYYVAANLLCTRWVADGQEKRSCWEIAINGDAMSWTALRMGDDGKTYTVGYELKKVA